MCTASMQDDWDLLQRFLPESWAAKAVELGALVRRRKIDSAETLLRVLLIHLADGKSLRSTVAYAREAQLCAINDTALLHRLRVAEEWLRWMAYELAKALRCCPLPGSAQKRFRIRLVDGTSISEPGSAGTDWRIHYAFRLDTLRCDTFTITNPHVAEDFQRYPVAEEDLLIGDRGYCKRKGITHVRTHGGQVLVRFHSNNLPLFTRRGSSFAVLEDLRGLSEGQPGDWDVWFRDPYDDHLVKGRLCALRKSPQAIELAHKRLWRKASRSGKKLQPQTLEYAEYVTLFTTVNRHHFTGEEVLLLYRGRWQIELVFKRLKGIIGIGHLPTQHPESCVAWLYGKMVVALLVERVYREAESISPWGYPLRAPAG